MISVSYSFTWTENTWLFITIRPLPSTDVFLNYLHNACNLTVLPMMVIYLKQDMHILVHLLLASSY